MRIFFLEKTVKIVSTSGLCPRTPICLRRLGASPPRTSALLLDPAYYYNFVGFVSSDNAFCSAQKRT